jgi:hypothetical protein
MTREAQHLEARIKTLNTFLSAKQDRAMLDQAVRASNGDMPAALASLKGKVSGTALLKVTLAHSVSEWADDHVAVVSAIADKPGIASLRDVALQFDVKKLTALVDPDDLPTNGTGATASERKTAFATTLQNKLFAAEPTAVLQRMARDRELPIADTHQRAGVETFFANQPAFNIRTTSIYDAIKADAAFEGIAEEHRAGVVEQLKTLQRVQAMSPVPAAVPLLMNANLTSAHRVGEIPESTFMSAMGDALGEETAREVYTSAVNANLRNENLLVTIRQAWRGSDVSVLGGGEPREARMAKLQGVADAQGVPLNFEALFGSSDYCECDDCLSVYSPAAYFVETLNYLRNNNLGPDPANPSDPSPGIRTDPKDISKTPLEKLFRRRPDLGCLELTCVNTFTVLPYIDLVNEVMESFVVNLGKYHDDKNTPKQALLDAFNVTDETTAELLAEPQHINYQAYCLLKDAVYPFTLPYHQPIDAARIFLKSLGTTRYELLNTFRTATEAAGVALPPAQRDQLRMLHAEILDRSADAEFLGITQEEHIILTREAFWPKAYFDLTLGTVHTQDDYRKKIGVRPVHQYYGYETEAEMHDRDETSKTGLTFVKGQFLPRSGLQYVDLVDLLRTRFINPAYPQGRALTVLESIRFSYRFLQSLVDPDTTQPAAVRFRRLLEFLEQPQALVPALDALLHPAADPCQKDQRHCPEVNSRELRDWVLCYFDRIGQLIVLESSEASELTIYGSLVTPNSQAFGTLRKDGTIIGTAGPAILGRVDATIGIFRAAEESHGPQVLDKDGANIFGDGSVRQKDVEDLHLIDKQAVPLAGPVVWHDGVSEHELQIIESDGSRSASITNEVLSTSEEAAVLWRTGRETCDLSKVRLVHLDGSALLPEEYDRIQRFIRLWHKLGWTIPETDLALLQGLDAGYQAGVGVGAGTTTVPYATGTVGFDSFSPECSDLPESDDGGCDTPEDDDDRKCPDIVNRSEDISVGFLHQLVAIRKMLDLTGLPLDKALAFWADINTAGKKSLYSRLFLTHNLLSIDKVFASDANGNYLTRKARISDHLPVLTAALRIKPDDLDAIVAFRKLPDELTLANVSAIYRHVLLAKTLTIAPAELPDVFALFGDPFKSAADTLALLLDWGAMDEAGFTFRQLNYLVRDKDDDRRPLGPTGKAILQISRTVYDGLNAIDRDHADLPPSNKEAATADLIRAKAGLIYEPSVVERIIGVLDGTTVYTTNAPVNQAFTIPETDSLATKLKYMNQKEAVPPTASIQVIGILTDPEKVRAKALSGDADWVKAIDRVGKQASQFFTDTLAGIFSKVGEARDALLVGDLNVPVDPNNAGADAANTAPVKRAYFLQSFLPFLRQRLAHRLIVDHMSTAAGLPNEITDVLLTDVLLVGASKQHAIAALEQIHLEPAAAGNDWRGFLIPSVDGAYTFVARSLAGESQPPPIVLDGQSIPFTIQQEDPSNAWSSDPATPVRLRSGRLYGLEVTGQPATSLQWKTASAPKALIPAGALLPDYSSEGVEEVFVKLFKSALVVNGFALTPDDVRHWQANGADFAADTKDFDFNGITVGHWRRLHAYSGLRDTLPATDSNLLELFKWAAKPGDPTKLTERIAAVTRWNTADLKKLIAADHFDLDHPASFRNEIPLVVLGQALRVAAAADTDINRLFAWANPTSKFSTCHLIAEGIGAALRARYDQSDWEQVVKPLNNQLREDQKLALIAYLLVQEDLRDWGVVDADSLFEFFLIDVQMDACMETSRIKQAISTVQLFVQRCLLGLEAPYGVSSAALDRPRWENWMQMYRVWEANRKVFLYPENWIKPGLRDDKSQFYKELESELLQKDINPDTVADALKTYLFKVDEVANLKVAGIFLEQATDTAGKPVVDKAGKPVYLKLHVFGHSRNAPYFFFYRYLHIPEKNWYPWEKMQVDIPRYDVEDKTTGLVLGSGSYLVPVVWNRRLLVFFPQFAQKTNPDPAVGEFWEIKLAWTELRNKKWTPKQVSADAIYTFDPVAKVVFSRHINHFNFTPRIVTAPDPKVLIEVYLNSSDKIGKFEFTGSQVFKSTVAPLFFGTTLTDFQVFGDHTIHTFQAFEADTTRPLMKAEPFFTLENTKVTGQIGGETVKFSHSFAHDLVAKASAGSVDDVFDYYLNAVTDKAEAFGHDDKSVYHELKRANSLYNWEAAFHAPMLLVDRLLDTRQFEKALNMCHHVFSPYAEGPDDTRVWRFPPFKDIVAKNVLEQLFLSLQPNTPDAAHGQINEWRNKPFQPHSIARSRPSAYMKWVAMKYLEILIAYGDDHFRRNTLESVPLAIQCYVLASHIYGPRGQNIPKRGKTLPQTYRSLLDKWDAFGNAMVELELAFPFSNQTPLPAGESNGVVGLANVFGFASTLYFCIPDNPQLRALRDTIDDRLFKIRHCQDIDGIERHLPLFEPPIDPALLVRAAAQGQSLASVLDDRNSPMPNYRFSYLLQKAIDLCAELKSLGTQLLSVKEKGDGEALARLRARHESSIHKLTMDVRKLQLEEASKALEALQEGRKAPAYRLRHNLQLVGEDVSKVPDVNADFGELPDQIERPIDQGGLKLIQYEKEEMDKATEANDKQEDVGRTETLANILHAVPNITFTVGIGVEVGTGFGGSNLGSAAQAVARANQVVVGNRSFSSTNAGRKATFLRQLQERVQQANIAGHEIKSIDKQVLTQQIRINIALQEIANQQKQIDHAREMEDFLSSKYTNQDLYVWMDSQVRTLYHQAYNLAYDLGKRAEKVFRFERGLPTSNFIQYGYWDAAYDGLLAGERLYVGLKQLEEAHQQKRAHDFEISKSVSLRQLNPLALIQLKESGSCEFALPEVLFDMDYAGHYLRRIKSVSLRIPCILGAHTSLNCTLRLLEHKFRTSAIAKNKNAYPEQTDATDERFSTVNIPISAIAVSSMDDEHGVFELNFHDERYLPFEGAGTIGKWRLELPDTFRQFDYDTITDVIMRVRYTSVDGGSKLKAPAIGAVQDYIKSVEDFSREEGLFAVFDLKNDFPNEWHAATHPPAGATERVLLIEKLREKLPIVTKAAKKIVATDLYLFVSNALTAPLAVKQGGVDVAFKPGKAVGSLRSIVAEGADAAMGDLEVRIQDTTTAIGKMWLVERYVLA